MTDGPTATTTKFGHPETLVAETDHWRLLARPEQCTLGAMVLICREPVTAFSALSPAAFEDFGKMVGKIEPTLRNFVKYDRINYLMLMMVDPDVHFHVLPRYDGSRSLAGMDFPDAGWPAQPVLGQGPNPDAAVMQKIVNTLRDHWPDG
ncbi:MAG: HIT family protein [Pseudomonadota bacterium]